MNAGITLLTILMLLPVNASADIHALAWLSGNWCGSNHGIYSEESWLPPRAGSMLGMHRDSRDGRLAAFEFLMIQEDGDGFAYRAQPGGREATVFRAQAAFGNYVAFWNRNNDFPKRVSYRLVDRNTLLARIDDGTGNGKAMEWTWTRDCAS